MLTSYQLALKHLSLNPGAGVTHISIGSSLTVFDLHHFRDTMTSEPSVGFSSQTYKYISYLAALGNEARFLDLNDSDSRVYIGQEKLQHYLEDVTKAMMISILDGDAKRTTTVGVGTSGAKVDTFLNALKRPTYYDINGNVYGRDNNAKPWSNWYTSVGVCTPVSVSRTDNVATVVTNPAHGMSAPLDVYWNGPIVNVVGDGSDFFKREVTTNGVRIMGAGTVGGQTAVPDAWLEKVAHMVELFTDVNGAGINVTAQRNVIKTLRGDSGTYHAGKPTIQRVARGAGADYTPNFLTDQGIIDWNLTNLFDTTVQNDMVWYLNSTGSGYGDGDQDAQEVIEHVFHTLHMHGLPADDIKLYSYLAPDWQSGDLYAAMEEAYDGGYWDSSGYGGSAWKTNADAFEVAAKEYLYLLNFCMFEYTSLWDGGSLSPEWSDSMRTQAGIQANNPLGYAFHNTYIAPVISKPSLATIRSIFQDGNTPDQDDPSLAGASGYVVSTAYDDWGVIMNLNTGIATSFNISTSTHPNGVPINIVDATTFTYTNVGINTPTTAVTGIASVQVGWGGTSNNLHLHFT